MGIFGIKVYLHHLSIFSCDNNRKISFSSLISLITCKTLMLILTPAGMTLLNRLYNACDVKSVSVVVLGWLSHYNTQPRPTCSKHLQMLLSLVTTCLWWLWEQTERSSGLRKLLLVAENGERGDCGCYGCWWCGWSFC